MDPEEKQVDEEWEHDQSECSVGEVTVEVGLIHVSQDAPHGHGGGLAHHSVTLFDIQNLPQIPQDSSSDTHKRKESDHLAPKGTCQCCTGRQKPEPPCLRKFPISLLVEFDIAEDRQGHEEDKRGVQEDKTSLDNMSVVCDVSWAARIVIAL